MSHFSDLGGATLVNPFTIHHKDKLTGGRPFMSTCVPQPVYLDLFDVRISHGAEWKDKVKDPNDPNFRMRSIIWARGVTKDSITVFSMDGAIGTFREIADVIIKPLPKGHVGGTKRATSSDGISFSGMSSHDVPEEGLMVEEPGTLLYVDPREDKWPSRIKDPHLCLEGYIDETEFNSLMQRLSMTHAPIQKAEIRVLLELFQYEVEASLSEPWLRQDYGFLMRSKDNWGTTRARVETLQLTYKPNVVPTPPEAKIDDDGIYQLPTPFEPVSAATVKKIEKHLKNIAAAVTMGFVAVVLIIAFR
ncbi:hypothetical protein [Rhizobium leguminosarum]|nr:hypothetical protein [Rhizobium leguminosarum]TBZ20696.1 hypothetical protein E0H52_12460 [Rhizobium leguminosarum bv. viciae]MBY5320158.1 hypothetical protein [Rhizobium leguminosarum]MBY5379408.1 hypothetical protein [Rhizobium leguminosarum]MBY5423418.1 hypothetical protein [Rhizobium leguminosarum]MCA2431345.1 hypothetical protein [Rhizobium leguminosarum]